MHRLSVTAFQLEQRVSLVNCEAHLAYLWMWQTADQCRSLIKGFDSWRSVALFIRQRTAHLCAHALLTRRIVWLESKVFVVSAFKKVAVDVFCDVWVQQASLMSSLPGRLDLKVWKHSANTTHSQGNSLLWLHGAWYCGSVRPSVVSEPLTAVGVLSQPCSQTKKEARGIWNLFYPISSRAHGFPLSPKFKKVSFPYWLVF